MDPAARSSRRIRFLLAGLAAIASPAQAQVAPSSAEVAAYQGRLPLHAAAATGNVAGIQRHLELSASPHASDAHGRTPLHVAAFASQAEAARALVAGGADPKAQESQRYDILTISAVQDDVPMLRVGLALGADPRAVTSPYNGTALIAAAHLGHDGIVKELIRAGAPLDHANNLGWTALIEAVILGNGGPRHVETVRALVEAGANLNIADRHGVTPLGHARQRGYSEMVAILEKAGGR